MAELQTERAATLRAQYHSQTAKIPWRELQVHYAGGNVVGVSSDLDLVDVAVQLGLDNTQAFEAWIAQGAVQAVRDEQALAWIERDAQVWAVVAAPWILVQERGVG